MEDWYECRVDEATRKKEREKARQLKKTNWWRAQLQQGICHYCGEKFKAGELTMDHVIPVARGGKSTKSNIVLCCKECNTEKKMMTPVDMIFKELNLDDDPEHDGLE